MIELLAAVFVFLAVTAGAMTVLRGTPALRAAEQRLANWRRPSRREGLDADDFLRRETSALPALRSLLSNSAWSERAALDLEQAGIRLKVSEYLLLRLLTAAAFGLITAFLAGGSGMGLILALLLTGVGFMLPASYVHLRKERRTAAITRQLVETFQFISNGLRSGFAFSQAVDMAAKQMEPPIQDELNHFLRDIALGATADEALRAMVKRARSYDLDMAVTAILIQRTAGGNLAEILDNVADTMRERERIRGEVRTLTAHQRFTGLVLSLWPVLLALLFFALVPSTMAIFFTDPLGRVVLGIGVSLQLIGAFAIRRIVAIDI